MLVLGHIGYTVGAAWALDSLTHRETQIDYRALALMTMAPDIIDRALFVFILPSALSGRLMSIPPLSTVLLPGDNLDAPKLVALRGGVRLASPSRYP